MVIDDFPVSLGDPFHFEWVVDQHGYELVHHEPRKRSTLLTKSEGGYRVVRKGGPLRAYRPLADKPGLFLEFAHCGEAPEAALEFTNENGFLGDGEEEYVDRWIESRRTMRFMVNAMEGFLRDEQPLGLLAPIFSQYATPRMTVRLDFGPARQPRLNVVPITLLSAMWLQVANQLTGGIKFRQCKWCSTWFPYGPTTRHKSTRKFCSDKCRVAWNRQKKKEM